MIFTLEEFITPKIMHIFYWLGMFGCVIGGIFLMMQDNGFFPGLVLMIIGWFIVRLVSEAVILFFSIQELLRDIKNELKY